MRRENQFFVSEAVIPVSKAGIKTNLRDLSGQSIHNFTPQTEIQNVFFVDLSTVQGVGKSQVLESRFRKKKTTHPDLHDT